MESTLSRATGGLLGHHSQIGNDEMAVYPISQIEEGAVSDPERAAQQDITVKVKGLAKYRRTIIFAITALLVVAVAAAVAATKVNDVIANLAEKQLLNLAEENTTRDARHIQSMITGGQGMAGMGHESASLDRDPPMGTGSNGSMATASGDSTEMTASDSVSSEKVPLTLELLTGPRGLPAQYSTLVEGLGVVKSTLLSPDGEIMWSTETHGPDQPRRNDLRLKNVEAGISSIIVKNQEFMNRDGTVRTMDVVETYVPLRDSPTSPVVGVLEITREVGVDLGQLVNETKSTVVWTTIATMAGLFFALLGFVVLSDRMIYQTNQRQLELVASHRLAERNRANEEAGRARAFESNNRELKRLTTQLVETQEQLVRSEKLAAIGQWSAGVAHDLRNPLGAIKNASYLLKKRLTSDGAIDADPKLGRYLEIVEQQIGRSDEIIHDLMTFANVGAPSLVDTHLDKVIEESLETIAKNDNVTFAQHLEPDLHPVIADGGQIRRVFLNLANNAQQAMPQGGRLTITAKNVDTYVEISFSDTGEGISDENLGKIFDPLFTTKANGTGLGLAVCHEIILRHGGTISVRRNKEPSGGTIFEVKLPAAAAQQDTE